MIILYVFLSVLILFLGICFWAYYRTFYSPKKGDDDIYRVPKGDQYKTAQNDLYRLLDNFKKYPYKDVFVKSHDNLTLRGKLFHFGDNLPLAICFHGYRAPALRDFCGIGVNFIENNFNVLLVDHRAHKISDGHTICFGIKERKDVISWIDFAKSTYGKDVKVVLTGISMGGATVLMASEIAPKNVIGIMADCPYNSPKDIIMKVCKDLKYNPKVVYPFIYLGALIYGRVNLKEKTVCEAVKNMQIPTIIIHGDDDRFVPCEMSEIISNANPKYIKRYVFEGAGHGICYLKDNEKYNKIVKNFIDEIL